jgi:hypothetical protein
MHPPKVSVPVLRVEGVVLRVDTINRELAVFTGGSRVVVDVPADCRIILRGEPVKLRMLQPFDRVKAACGASSGLPVARSIEVQPG